MISSSHEAVMAEIETAVRSRHDYLSDRCQDLQRENERLARRIVVVAHHLAVYMRHQYDPDLAMIVGMRRAAEELGDADLSRLVNEAIVAAAREAVS